MGPTDTIERLRPYFKIALLGTVLVYCWPLVRSVLANFQDLQWDFGIYYLAAEAHRLGQDPYSTEALSQIAGRAIGLPFVYPPPLLYLFRPFLWWDYPIASLLYLNLKGLFLLGLYYLWQRNFLSRPLDLLFFPFSLMALNSPIYLDLRSGNIALLEQFLIWIALMFYLRRQTAYFCVFVLLSASFKVTPILFLGLLWWSPDRRRLQYGLATGLGFLGYLLSPLLVNPPLFRGFVNNLSGLREGGRFNPSSLAFLTDLLGRSVSEGAVLASVVLLSAVVVLLSWKALSSQAIREDGDRDKILCFLFCLAYALVLPRFKDYSYLLLVVPCYWILRRFAGVKGDLLLVSFVLFSTPAMLWDTSTFSLLWDYAPLLGAYAAWGGYLYWILWRDASGGMERGDA